MHSCRKLSNVVSDSIAEHLFVVGELHSQHDILMRIATAMTKAILAGRTIFWCGNGGSAADSQHLAAELVGRFCNERRAVSSLALTADSAVLTAVANDYSYNEVFSRQVEALCRSGDVMVGMSTSGNSANVCYALQAARDCGAFTVALTGESGGRLAAISDICIQIASREAARIQEAHILCGHILCQWVELAVSSAPQLAAAGSEE